MYIINLDRYFWTGRCWTDNRQLAKNYDDLLEAKNACEPLVFKAYVVSCYGRHDEKEEYRNFETLGRSLTWGRWEPE